MHALPFEKVPAHTMDRILGLKKFDDGIGYRIGIIMSLIMAFKRFYGSRKLVPILAGYLATTAGCTSADIKKICFISHN